VSPAAARRSAGILLYRRTGRGQAADIEVLLAHMGGPYFARKDDGAWSIPKGEYDASEQPWDAARREFAEEIGRPPPDGPAIELGSVTQRNGKVVTAYALEGDLDPETMHSNTFELEWPPRSGRMQTFPEMDRAAWFTPDVARTKALSSQGELIDRLQAQLGT
jgi:predicted NUDIX family NTP pyrophosphohydrolase